VCSLEEDVASFALLLHTQTAADKTFGRRDAVAGWRSRVLESVGQEFTSLLIDELYRHELLVENDLLVAVRRRHATNASDILQDYQAERHVLPEEASLQVQHNLAGVGGVRWHHREGHTAVAEVGVENALEARLVGDLTFVHGTDALGDRQYLGELELGEPAHQILLDGLDLIVEVLNFGC